MNEDVEADAERGGDDCLLPCRRRPTDLGPAVTRKRPRHSSGVSECKYRAVAPREEPSRGLLADIEKSNLEQLCEQLEQKMLERQEIKAELGQLRRKILKRQEDKAEQGMPPWKRWPRAFWRNWLRPVWLSWFGFPFRILFYGVKVTGQAAMDKPPLYNLDKILQVSIAALVLFSFAAPLVGAAPIANLPKYRFHNQQSITSKQFSVYDCDDPRTQYAKIDLTATQSCPDPVMDYDAGYEARVMVLQSDALVTAEVYTCQVFFTKEVYRCGVTHTSYGSERIAIDQRLEVSAEQCREWRDKKVFNSNGELLGGRPQLIPLTVGGQWAHHDYISHGGRDLDGNCVWDSWTWRGRQFTQSYERTTLRFRLQKIGGQVNQETGTMTVSNGLQVNYADGTVKDGVEGTLVWDTHNHNRNCTDRISLLYDGPVMMHKLNKGIRDRKTDQWAGTIVVMENPEEKQTGAFIIKAQRATCLNDCHLTHIPGILVCLNPHRVKDHFVYKPGERQTAKMVVAAVTHTRVGVAFDTGEKFGQIQQQLCGVSLDGKLHQLGDLAHNGNAYALRKLVVPGVPSRGRKYIPGGAAGYVASCVEKNATLAYFHNCSLQIPVFVHDNYHHNNNATEQPLIRFADPITLVVQQMPTIVSCSSSLPIRWLIQDKWFCSTPRVAECGSPTRIGTDLNMEGLGPNEADFNPLGHTLYSPEQQAENEAFQRSLDYREPILQEFVNEMSKGATMDASGNIHFGSPFNDEQLDGIAMRVTGKIFFMMAFFGKYYNIIVGALFLLAVGKLLFGVALRTYVLYRKKGCGLWLFTAVWHTSFLLFGMPWRVAKKVYDGAMEEVDKAQQENLVPGDYEHLSRAVQGLTEGLERQQGLLYTKEAQYESLVRAIAASDDHNLAKYAKSLLKGAEQPIRMEQDAGILNQATTQDNGSSGSK